jgi:hypothetical protein
MGSVSLTGDINYLDPRAGVAPVKVRADTVLQPVSDTASDW